jgi:hypothetical protein
MEFCLTSATVISEELTLRDFFFSGSLMALTGGLLTVTLGILLQPDLATNETD